MFRDRAVPTHPPLDPGNRRPSRDSRSRQDQGWTDVPRLLRHGSPSSLRSLDGVMILSWMDSGQPPPGRHQEGGTVVTNLRGGGGGTGTGTVDQHPFTLKTLTLEALHPPRLCCLNVKNTISPPQTGGESDVNMC